MISSITLHSAFHQLRANLAGKFLTCSFRPLCGAALPQGRYKISAPMHNSVYGTFALLSAAGVGRGWIDRGVETGWIDRGVETGWIERGWITTGWINQPEVFVLVAKPLAGRNCIVITSGFAEFMAALQQAGGASVTVT